MDEGRRGKRRGKTRRMREGKEEFNVQWITLKSASLFSWCVPIPYVGLHVMDK